MDEHTPEEPQKTETGFDRLLQRVYRPGPLIALFTMAFLGLVVVACSVLNEEPPPPPVMMAKKTVEPVAPLVYEETLGSKLEDMVKQADFAIIETMRSTSLNLSELNLVDVTIRRLNGHGYHYQVLQLPALKDRKLFLETLASNLANRVPEAKLASLIQSESTISISGNPTHRLLLETIPMQLPTPPSVTAKPEVDGPVLAIVIDDIGENMKVLDGMVELSIPLTFAVWPNASSTRQAIEVINRKHRDLIVHFPMEPQGYPKVKPGSDAVFVSMSKDKMIRQVKDNLAKIPNAIGVNNHMGSRFTSDESGMKTVLAEFKQRGLFFLDSLTTGKSVGRSVAQKVGIPFYERDIFIDNVKDPSAVVHQLKKAERVAKKQGYAIAIGHPYPATLAGIKAWAKKRDVTIRVLSLSKLPAENM